MRWEQPLPARPAKGTLVATTGPAVTSYTNTGLKAGTTYSYALFAYDTSSNYARAATITVSSRAGPVHISGTITTSTTWSPAAATAYILDGTVDIPAGVTLTIGPGTVIKSLGGALAVEGTLNSNGTSATAVTFTSVNDNSAGGSTEAGTPKPSDWGGIYVSGAGSVDLEDTTIEYAGTAFQTASSAPQELSGVTIENNELAMDASNGNTGLRGTLSNNAVDITSCDWGSGGCTVDATYTDWGDGSAGPFPSSGPLVCGAVTVSPWLPTGSAGNTFADGNCDGQAAPDTTLSDAETAYSQGVAGEQIQCDNNIQDACQAIQTAENCLSGAYSLAQSRSSFTLQALGRDVVRAGSSFLEDSSSLVITGIGYVAKYANDILGVVGTIIALANAYYQCDP